MAEKKFGERTFRTNPVLATKLMVVQARFFRMAGPAIASLPAIMQGYGKDKTEAEKNASNMAAIGAFSDIFAATPPEEVADMIRVILEMAELQKPSGAWDKVDVDGDFTHHMADVIPVTIWVVREQFGDFFSGLQDIGSPSGRA